MPTDEEDNKPVRVHIELDQTEAQKVVEEDPELQIHYVGKKAPIRKIEQDIIDTLTMIAVLEEQNKKEYSYTINGQIDAHEKIFQALMNQYQAEPFGNSTETFLNTPIIKKYFREAHLHENKEYWFKSHLYYGDNQALRLWTLIEHYTLETSKIKKGNYLERIKKELETINKEIFKPSGQGLFTHINKDLIKNIYLSNDPKLINLVMKNSSTKLPIPGIEVFEGGPIPPIIQQRQLDIQTGINKFLEKRALGVEIMLLEKQRRIRGNRRNKEEHARLEKHPHFSRNVMPPEETAWRKMTTEKIQSSVTKSLKDANTPYRPQKCSPELAQKIMDAAGKVNLFTTVRHLTSETHLTHILDEGLFGRRTLLQQYTPFKPAALSESDLEIGGGDANVICFGPNEIDPKAKQSDSIEITMNLDKIESNPCIFYKQRDLGLPSDVIHQIRLGGTSLYCSQTKSLRIGNLGYVNLQIFQSRYGELTNYSELPNYLFIAYDLPNIHQILTLNFFRFVDTLRNTNGSEDISSTKSIYQSLDKLSPEELVATLEELGKKMTSTSEFNFYGAYKIDFKAVQSIKSNTFTLTLPTFISALQAGDLNELTKTEKAIPNLFKSHRFLDYLLTTPQSKTYPKEILDELQRIRATCATPKYLITPTQQRPQPESKMPPPPAPEVAKDSGAPNPVPVIPPPPKKSG